MKRAVSCIIIVILLFSIVFVCAYADGAVPQDVLDSVESVVRIIAEYNDGYATGSGFVIQSDSNTTLIATNHHVVEDNPKSISIWTESGSKVSVSIFVDDPEHDLCILQFPYPNAALKALVLDKDGVKRGDAVYAVGFPGAADDLSLSEAYSSEAATITTGIISAIRTTYAVEGGKEFQLLQSTAPINHGNSGGPLFNTQGHVVGVNTYSVEDADGIYGAISIGDLIDLAENHSIAVLVPEEPHSSNSPNTSYIIGASSLAIILTAMIVAIVSIQKKRKKKEEYNRSQNQTQLVSPDKGIEAKPTANEQKASGSEISAIGGPNDNNPVAEQTESTVVPLATEFQISEAEPAIPKDEVLFENEPNTVFSGIPVLIEKVMLTKSPQTGDLAAACSFRSLTEKPLLAMLIDIHCSDIWGNPTESVEDFQYLDLKTGRGVIFGRDQNISIPNRATRFIEIEIKRVIFADRTLAESNSKSIVLPAQEDLASFFGSEELKKEYIRETGINAQYTVTTGGGYWRCTCGTINTEEDNSCYRCGALKDDLLKYQNVELISANLELYQKEMAERAEKKRSEREKYIHQAEEKARLAKEEQERKRRAEATRLAEEIRQKKEAHKKRVKRISIISAAVLLIAILSYITFWHVIPSIRYNNADTALKNEQYDVAFEGFTALDSYKDSAEKAKEARYQKACSLMNSGSYPDAATEFSKVADYKDSRDQETFCKNEAAYLDAKALLESGKYPEAAEAFTRLGDFSDSAEQVDASNYLYAKQLLDSKSFEDAHTAFAALGDYEDSKVLADESYYQLATKYLEAKEYKNAYDTLGKVSRYKDSADLQKESCYQFATELFNKEEYEEAYTYFRSISAYKDSTTMSKESKYCQAISLVEKLKYKEAIEVLESTTLKDYKDTASKLKETQYSYAQQLAIKGKYSTAMDLYKKLGDYKDSKSKYLENKYKYGLERLRSSYYKDAVSIFKDLGNYKDSKDKLKEAKYGYVLAHKNNNDTTTYEYLKDLKSAGYANSKDIYTDLYAWKVINIYFNSSENGTNKKYNISKYDPVYCHFEVSGGPPGETTYIYHTVTMPDGSTKAKKRPEYKQWRGDKSWWGWEDGLYTTPYYGATGTLTFKFYDEEGNLIGKGSVAITN